MKRFISASLSLIVCGVFLYCSKKIDLGDPSSVIHSLVSAKGYEQRIIFFSSKSVKLIADASRGGNFAGSAATLPILSGKVKWTEKERRVDGDRAVIKIVIASHESENLTGSELTLMILKERGDWKIDISDELTGMKTRGIGADDYIRRLENQ